MKKKLSLVLILNIVILGFSNQFALAEDFSIKGETQTVIANPVYNINPWNTIKVTGVGEGNKINIVTTYETFGINLDRPLYKISDFYKDEILCKDGIWGVERKVGVKVFDGSENWELYSKRTYKNDKTVVFISDFEERVKIQDGFSTHFDMHNYETQKENIYDGISFDESGNKVIMRFMNVRNVNNAEDLKTYLKTQIDNGNPVKLFYVLPNPEFQPFDEDTQKKLNENKILGHTDGMIKGMRQEENTKANTEYFVSETSGNDVMDRFLSSVTDCLIYNNSENNKFYINELKTTDKALKIEIKSDKNVVYKGEVLFADYNFSSNKPQEILLKGDGKEIIRIMADLSKIQIPKDVINGFTFEETGLNKNCDKTIKIVLPNEIIANEGEVLNLFNSIVYEGDINSLDMYAEDLDGNVYSDGKITATKDTEFKIFVNRENIGSTKIVLNHKKAEENIGVMFLGDSLINENHYTEYFKANFNDDKINLIGTRGNEGNKHEGRGGWSAYDYCNENSKFGFTNPFLNNGKFDFEYYIKSNEVEKLDFVVINLGINDLNLVGHNGTDEILGYLDQIVTSIKAYDNNIEIILNAPVLPFYQEETVYAKERRLLFTQEMYEYFKERDIYIAPSYLRVDSFSDFKFLERKIDEENQDYALYVKDTTHPNLSGYKALGNGSYTDILNIYDK